MSERINIKHLPTEFRGCQWDDHWEFDAPAIIYYPRKFRRYGFGGNTSAIDDVLEEICDALAIAYDISDGGLDEECEFRGWGSRFDRRRNANHVLYRVRWYMENGDIKWEVTDRVESYGLPPVNRKDEQ
jgi:hypothetical protein